MTDELNADVPKRWVFEIKESLQSIAQSLQVQSKALDDIATYLKKKELGI